MFESSLPVRSLAHFQDKGTPYVKQDTVRVKQVLQEQLTPEKEAQIREQLKVLAISAK